MRGCNECLLMGLQNHHQRRHLEDWEHGALSDSALCMQHSQTCESFEDKPLGNKSLRTTKGATLMGSHPTVNTLLATNHPLAALGDSWRNQSTFAYNASKAMT